MAWPHEYTIVSAQLHGLTVSASMAWPHKSANLEPFSNLVVDEHFILFNDL